MQQLSNSVVSSPDKANLSPSGLRLRKKHKRLDAICETVYNRHHNEHDERNGRAETRDADNELRRSTRLRRAPVRDVSVSPPRVSKRRKFNSKTVSSSAEKNRTKTHAAKESESESERPCKLETSSYVWKTRLRSKTRNVGFEVENKGSEWSGKRRLFGEESSELNEKKVDLVPKPLIVYSERVGKVKSLNNVGKERREEIPSVEGNCEREEPTVVQTEEGHANDDSLKEGDKESKSSDHVEESESGEQLEASDSGEQVEASDSGEQVEASDSDEQVEASESDNIPEDAEGNQVEEVEIDEQVEALESDNIREDVEGNQVEEVEIDEQMEESESDELAGSESSEQPEELLGANKQVEELESGEEVETKQDIKEANGNATNDVSHDDEDGDSMMKPDERPTEDENAIKATELNLTSTSKLGKARVKQGRRCGLCGGGTDGKPPKPSLQDTGESENELYSGSSASEEPNYDIWDGFGDESGWLGRLLGPINDRYGIAGIWVHQHCAVWSPEVYFAGLGHLKNIRTALCRGRALKCTRCVRPGATIGCRVDRCPKTYHLPCARANGCIFDHRKFLIACTDHRHLFQPHGRRLVARMKKLKARKMKLETRKLADDASRRDLEAEEKWLENCGEDEEFLKRESKRLHRDLLRVAPVYIGGPGSEDNKNIFEDWESVAGLQDVIRSMKEVVILPLLYPEFFDNLGLTPPRGVLLHGYPGTGKTLVVRALIGSCARGDKRIAYFARKGADCLGKYVGDAERQLRLLFQVAERSQPSIIFFDEIDGLAPCRTRQQDQTHNSVVSTLLALMDGLKSRGSVVVIGATNRPDAVDPALRRPGRFDREIYFPLPSQEDRAAILSLHTRRWPKPVSGSLLKWVAQKTVGFAGADLQALCTQAVIIALKRNFPLQEMLSAAEKKLSGGNRVPLPFFSVEERDWLEALSRSPPPCSRREAGIAANDLASSPLPTHLIPCMLWPLSTLLVSLYLDERIWLPPSLSKGAKMVKNVIVSTLEKKKLPADRWWSHINDFLHEPDIAKEVEAGLSRSGIVNGEDNLPGSDDFSDVDCDSYGPQSSIAHKGGAHSGLLHHTSIGSRKSGFRILIDGNARSGQRHLASCLLHCFLGNVEVQKIDLATVSQEGHGDVVQGMTQILMKCSSVGSCMIFMPRIDLWAVETFTQVNESDPSPRHNQFSEKEKSRCAQDGAVGKESKSHLCKMSDIEESQGLPRCYSHAWSLFVEQLESSCVSTSLMILATSEIPFAELPHKIKQLFQSDSSSDSRSMEHRGLRFSVEVGGNFNRDAVITHSLAALSRNLIQSLVQLIHQRSHAHTVKKKPCDFLEDNKDFEHHIEDNTAANEPEERVQHPANLPMKVLLPDNRTSKMKSNLHLSISTFGYQILQYPHFAELCWVASKLKEGPHFEINRDWKGWPFNTCIIHSSNSLDKVAIAFWNRNIKIKEKFGVVRGLIAVGLSAYRGVYGSLREVSFDVHKVLELLVGQINAKIRAGKNKYQYTRLLSQVAHLEDVVSSWAYGLQSLEVDAHLKATDPVPRESGKENVSENCHCESAHQDGSPGCPDLAEEGSAQNITVSAAVDRTDVVISEEELVLDKDPIKGDASEPIQLDDKYINGQKSSKNGSCDVDGPGKDSEQPQHFNDLAVTNSIFPAKNGLRSLVELDGVNISSSEVANKKVDGLPVVNNGITSGDSLSSSKPPSHHAKSEALCVYRCCSECLKKLHNVMRKVVIDRSGINKGDWTVDDVHDIVSTLSVDLLAAVKKVYESDNNASSHVNYVKLSNNSETKNCRCSSGKKLFVPVECGCHVLSENEMENTRNSASTKSGLGREFVFSDGVLVPSDSNTDVPFHCKFKTLCLCSLLESILMKKKPF